MNKIKQKNVKCKAIGCNNMFLRTVGDIRQWCSYECGYNIAKAKMDLKSNKERREKEKQIKVEKKIRNLEQKKRKDDLEPINSFLKKACDAAKAYARWRDRNELCISCNKPLALEPVYDGGHYMSVGAKRWLACDADYNIHGQCRACNSYQSTKVRDEFTRKLTLRIGEDKVLELQCSQPSGKSFTREELVDIKNYWVKRLKDEKNLSQ